MFPPVDKDRSFPERELDVLRFWKERDTYHKSLAKREGAEPFVFYEGPPTANGLPHPGHCLTRAIKDLFPRYKTMRGYRCERKAGWDTHGLPVETEVCKELGIHAKEEIEAYGVEKFIHRCQASVWRYMNEWERLTERIGFWVDLKNAYVTYHQSYVESVWWSLKNLFDRGLLYQGHKIVWWWAQGGTALSSGEVGQGYREVADPSVYVKFPIVGDQELRGLQLDGPTSFLVWTTTPWTLPSNQFAAVSSDTLYAVVLDETLHERFVVAGKLVDGLSAKLKRELKVMKLVQGSDLVGLRYVPPFEGFRERLDRPVMIKGNDRLHPAWRVVAEDFVTTDSGTGIVHIAPAFGEDDFNVLMSQREIIRDLPLINCVAPDGKFTDEAPDYCRGRWVKDCDKDIIRDLKQRGLLFHQERYLHDYPFCWRAEEDPLIQYPRESWFIRTTAFKDAMLVNNSHINWLPEHIKEGRFGKFLESNVDWALSRERFWGTPLPIWVCEETGQKEAVSSYAELEAKPGFAGGQVWAAAKEKNPELPDDLRVHKPYIDAVTYDSPFAKGARMKRVPDVIDVWYDSGAMPFAQWGYRGDDPPFPRREGQGERLSNLATTPTAKSSSTATLPSPNLSPEGRGTDSAIRNPLSAIEKFHSQFPADFISEAIDQTRGWFYSQLAISTMLFGENPKSEIRNPKSDLPAAPYPHPFRTCIVLGLMLGEDGQKMSKSKRNYREPGEIFDRYGADALRWYFFANQPPWTSIRYSEQAIRDSVPEFLLRLWNVYSFFTIYANIDGFVPGRSRQSAGGKGLGARDSEASPSAAAQRAPLAAAQRAPLAAAQRAAGAAQVPAPRPLSSRSELDRWITSELNRTLATVVERMDQYDNYAACGAITQFVDALSNWYVRRSRDRFWAADKQSLDKLDAYETLYECLMTTAKMIAPFTPFLAESLWQNLAVAIRGENVEESVHLCDYPTPDQQAIDVALSERMNLVRHIASLGRQARTSAALKVRQPLARVEVILADATHQPWLEAHAEVIADELNVKQVEFSDEPEKYVDHEVLPNFKLLGPKLGKLMPKVKPALARMSGSELLANIRDNGKIDLAIDGQQIALAAEEVEVRLQAKPGWTAANDKGVVVVLATEVTPQLLREGWARDLVRVIQDRRKEIGCEFTDRIDVSVVAESADLKTAIEEFREYIMQETLAESLRLEPAPQVESVETQVGDARATLSIRRTLRT
ncbi:MAG: isoleucine--tRNA ligase [Planctomycetota bacterium]|nr:MAG: isoleucine--tRNA ligase [Planctomycetota bacterium]